MERESARVLTWISNKSDRSIQTPIHLTIADATSNEARGAVESEMIQIPAGETILAESELCIADMIPWSPESPQLYVLSVTTSDDHLNTRFGMREFHFDPETKVPMLNGKPYYLRGTSVPIYRFAEDPLRGDKLWNERWVRKLFSKFREMHWNTIRFHVGPAPEMWYRIADEMGMIIQDEYAVWTFSIFRTGITLDTLVSEYVDWMEERWNHASVLIWDAQNESTQKKEPRTGWALSMVRDLDLSHRPWDNGWGQVQRETDMVELHPYLYTRSMINFRGKELDPLPAVDTFRHTDPDSILLGNGVHPAVVNEYAWLWIRRDGEPTTLTSQGYGTYFPGFTASERFEYYARNCAIQTEYYRALRAAGVMQFAGLNSNYPGCKTTDIFVDIDNLVIEPHIQKYVRDAFSPVGICIWNWDSTGEKGMEKRIPIVLFNDLSSTWEGPVEISMLKEGVVVSRIEVGPVQVGPSEKAVIESVMKYPDESGDYEMKAEITGTGDQPVCSYRKIEIK
jgi:hypothetical protein